MEIQEEIVQRLRTIAEDMHSLKKEIEGLNDRTEKMYKTDKQWLELIVGGAGLAYMGSAIILAAIFYSAYKLF